MKPQRKAVVARKAQRAPITIAKKRRASPDDKLPRSDTKKSDLTGQANSDDEPKHERLEETKKKTEESERKKLQQLERRRKMEMNKRKAAERRREKMESKKKVCREREKKSEALCIEEECGNEGGNEDTSDKKRSQKSEEKAKTEKQTPESKRNNDTREEQEKTFNGATNEEKNCEINVKTEMGRKKGNSKNPTSTKEKKVAERQTIAKKQTSTGGTLRKESRAKQMAQKKPINKIVLAKKCHSPLGKKTIMMENKLKLVKKMVKSEDEDDDVKPREDEREKLVVVLVEPKSKKKIPAQSSGASSSERNPKLGKQMRVKPPPKSVKMSGGVSWKEKMKVASGKRNDVNDPADVESLNEDGHDKIELPSNRDNRVTEANVIKREIFEDKDEDKKKTSRYRPKMVKKSAKRVTKGTMKSQRADESDESSTKSDDVSLEELMKQTRRIDEAVAAVAAAAAAAAGTVVANSNKEDAPIKMDLKFEVVNNVAEESGCGGEASPTSASDSEDNYVDEIESRGRGKRKKIERRAGKEEGDSSPLDERARRMRLFGFWSGPKRHRVASLNALAKVHCLYENEAGGVYLGGFCKPKPDNQKPKRAAAAAVTTKEEIKDEAKQPKPNNDIAADSSNKRNLRTVPGLRGKHWDMMESSSSSSSSSSEEEEEEDAQREKTAAERLKKRNTTRRKKIEQVMDLKDMVVCKRMASLNASAILAASYSDEKNRLGSSASDTSSESEVEIISKRRKQADGGVTEKKRKSASRRAPDTSEQLVKSPNKVVIVNQDTDVTITGVYVNQTRSTHHEGFCSIAGMQYRISSTSHTQTAATAVAAELHEQQKPEQPCKSYTPLGALSSMQPPGSQANHPNLSPRRHSAFSAPHQHGYYQPAGPLIQHPPTLPPVKASPPEPTPTPPQNSEGSDDLVATSTTSGGTNSTGGGGFYRAYCPQYYGTPPQYQELCYPPTYPHPHSHPPPYYKYAPTYRRQYYGYPGAEGGGGTGGGAGPGPGVVEYQSPPQPGEYPMPPYYGAYPPPPPPLPPPPNPAYLHAQGRPIVDHATFQGCPCPMQSCPKNVDTGPLIGNGKGAPVASGPGLSLPPSALVGPPSPARGLAGLAPPHGANAWDTDRVQLNTHRSNLNSQSQQQQQQITPASSVHGIVSDPHGRAHNSECRTKNEKTCTEDKLGKCNCQKRACTSTCEVKLEALSPTETLSSASSQPSSSSSSQPSSSSSSTSSSRRGEKTTIQDFKLENNNVKCESCSVGIAQDNISCSANCNVKCETGYKCEIIKCEQCIKEGEMTMMELEKDTGIMDDKRLDVDSGVKEELNDVMIVDTENWRKPDYEAIAREVVTDDKIIVAPLANDNHVSLQQHSPKRRKLTKRKLSLDSLSDLTKKRKVDKRTLSLGSTNDFTENERVPSDIVARRETAEIGALSEGGIEKLTKKDSQKRKNETETISNVCESGTKRAKITKSSRRSSSSSSGSNGIENICFKNAATESSINETINHVIQQSLKMSQKKKIVAVVESKKGANSMPALKKVSRKINLVKGVVAEKLSLAKITIEDKITKEAAKSKNENKLGANKSQDPKSKSQSNNRVKMDGAKSVETKPKVPEMRSKETTRKIEIGSGNNVIGGSCNSTIGKNRVIEIFDSSLKRAALVRKKRKSTKTTTTTTCVKKVATNAAGKQDTSEIVIDNCSLAKRPFLKPKWSNGWSWEGDSYEAKVYLTNEESAIRRCYASMTHVSGDVLRPRDCVLLKSGQRKADLPFVAKIAALWENPEDGEMMFSLLWYYRPEHTEQGRTDYDTEDEVFASRHRDANSVACIEDKCYILTFNEYCRYRKNLRRIEEGLESPGLIVPPGEQGYTRECRQPPIPVPSDMVLFCRRVYDYRGKKLVKNPG